jgi:hypothetical protein
LPISTPRWLIRKETVAGALYDPASVLRDLRINQLRKMGFQTFMRAFLIRAHQPRISRHIRGYDRRETADSRHCSPGKNGLNQIYSETGGSPSV